MERDKHKYGFDQWEFVISTHALTWSATNLYERLIKTTKISTHALTWSATLEALLIHDEGDISTHALTWSATRNTLKILKCSKNFNSRAHVERDRGDHF